MGDHTLEVRGLNWGEQNTMLGVNQVIRICPFTNMGVKPPENANPQGPDPSTCFNCTEYGSADELQLARCNGAVPPGFQPTDRSWPEASKNAYCSRLTCTGIPPGIGGGYAVFVDIAGEPPSVVVNDFPPSQCQKPLAESFTTKYATFNYALPVITKLSSSNLGMACDATKCEASPGDILTVTAENLPHNEAIVETYRRGLPADKQQDEIVYINLGDMKCPITSSNSSTQAVCTVPVSSGRGFNLTLVVAGQSNRAPSTFDFPMPSVDKVSPASVPSYGGEITITGKYFADKGSVAITDKSDSSDYIQIHACDVTKWSQTEIVCTTGSSGGAAEIVKDVVVSVASGDSSGSLTYAACSFSNPGEVCLSDGKYSCTNNYECSSTNDDCNTAGAVCSCPEDADDTLCGNGGKLDRVCKCVCVNGWVNSGHELIPGAVPKAYTNGTCSSCPVSCSGLDKKVQSASKCGCEFDKLHLIWIIFLVLLVVGAIGFGVWKWKSKQPKKVPLLNKGLLNNGAKDDRDEEVGDRQEAQESTEYA
jgi:hypothetical protein